jgi:hypothetical protein
MSAQTPPPSAVGWPLEMVISIRGVPLIAEQTEQRTGTLDDGASAVGIVKGKVFRDMAGRFRIDAELISQSGQSVSVTKIFDPIGHQVNVLVNSERLGFRFPSPEISVSQPGPFVLSGFGDVHAAGE